MSSWTVADPFLHLYLSFPRPSRSVVRLALWFCTMYVRRRAFSDLTHLVLPLFVHGGFESYQYAQPFRSMSSVFRPHGGERGLIVTPRGISVAKVRNTRDG